MAAPRPIVLTILDGFGESSVVENNAILQANTPTIDMLKTRFPHGVINASELHVGLPEGQMGNSEVGHMNIGSGRVLMQELPRIDRAIKDGSLARNPELQKLIATLKSSHGACHVMGLLSTGGVHSHQHHMAALVNILRAEGIKVIIHAFLDGRDTPPKSALEYLAQFRKEVPDALFGTVSGRYYAMDRDKRWDRVERAYRAIAEAQSEHRSSIEAAINASYASDKTDEFLLPAVIDGYKGVRDGDALIMANFRADRAREILSALSEPEFTPFARRTIPHFSHVVGMVEYSESLNKRIATLFAPTPLKQILGEVLAERGLKQLRIAETEKYAHVTFFFNGGREEPFAGESRILVPSPNVATYDMKPEMSAFDVTDKLVDAIDSGSFDVIIVNYANTDMVGHTGSMKAAISAVETVDMCLARVWEAVERKKGAMIITADHGNAEQMHDHATEQAHTAHTMNLVPIILAVPHLAGKKLAIEEGKLADIAPTILTLMGIEKPAEMTGNSLI